MEDGDLKSLPQGIKDQLAAAIREVDLEHLPKLEHLPELDQSLDLADDEEFGL